MLEEMFKKENGFSKLKFSFIIYSGLLLAKQSMLKKVFNLKQIFYFRTGAYKTSICRF